MFITSKQSSKSYSVVPPPVPPPDGIEKLEAGKCPVCGKDYENEVAIPSGVIGCYKCILGFVREKGYCPVTQIRTAEEEIRRLYIKN
ncbi:hypothetical protein O9G_002097 [Rozella allomycis CSF55]|uniref:Peroxin-12 n=1 Tax=Rozella allomycis (strain CSF55) TaxID=988480 RepID=A0A075B504_ROZAC|nr:hypothetical protein O9G_002097 [Rozella allomycis CSF55]|eukprot:EPZ36816.1 hypothetical protein O9G_002097 [Rozella allomycis CSF55]